MENEELTKRVIEKEIASGKIIRCINLKCGILTEKNGGCNYMKCTTCDIEWCWVCKRIKYKECNEKSHNSQ